MLQSSTPAASPAADPPVVPSQRLEALDQLNRRWRSTVDRLTELSIELHGFDDDTPPEQIVFVETRLAAARRSLVEIETSLQRLRLTSLSAVAG